MPNVRLQLSDRELAKILADPQEAHSISSRRGHLLKSGAKLYRHRPNSDIFVISGYAHDASDIKATLATIMRPCKELTETRRTVDGRTIVRRH